MQKQSQNWIRNTSNKTIYSKNWLLNWYWNIKTHLKFKNADFCWREDLILSLVWGIDSNKFNVLLNYSQVQNYIVIAILQLSVINSPSAINSLYNNISFNDIFITNIQINVPVQCSAYTNIMFIHILWIVSILVPADFLHH